MASEYNGKLIVRLLSEYHQDRVKEIIGEIEEINDPVFLDPLLAAYQKFEKSPISHYFIDAIAGIKSKEALNAIVEICKNSEFGSTNFIWALKEIPEAQTKDTLIIGKALALLGKFSSNYQTDSYELGLLLEFLSKADVLIGRENIPRLIFENDQFSVETKKTALYHFLRLKPREHVQYYLNNYEEIKGKQAEILLAKELVGWKNGNIPKLKKLILEQGSPRAKEILMAEQQEEKQERQQEVQKEESRYLNSGIIDEIVSLRDKINLLGVAHPIIKSALFPQSELFIKQTRAVQDEPTFVTACLDVREILQGVHENIQNHGVTIEKAREKFPSIQEDQLKKSTNALEIFLWNKDISAERAIKEFRKVNMLVNKLAAHRTEKDEATKILRQCGLYELFIDEDWSKLHRRILEFYRDGLKSLHNVLASGSTE